MDGEIFCYAGPLEMHKGLCLSRVEMLHSGPFKFKAYAYDANRWTPMFAESAGYEQVFYYLTAVGFKSDWKGMKEL